MTSERSAAAERAGRATHAEVRWPVVVRTLVLLGVPLVDAERLAGEAVARLLEAPATDDLDVALFAAVVAAWEDDPVAWWAEPAATGGWPGEAGYADLEPALDRLDPSTRARLVLTEVARLAPEQVDAVVLGGGAWPPGLGPAVVDVADQVVVGAPAVGGASPVATARRSRLRTRAVLGSALVALVAVVVGAAVVGLDSDGEVAGPARPVQVVTVRIGTAQPVPWYDGRSVRLDGAVVPVDGLRSMTRVQDGVAGRLADGSVVVVRPDGVQDLGRADEDSPVVASPDARAVAWLDAGALVVARVPPTLSRDEVPPGAVLVGRDATRTYLSLPDGHLVVPDNGTGRRVPGPVPPAVALGTALSPDGLFRVVPDPAAAGASSRAVAVVDARNRRPVPLALPDGVVVDAVFGPLGIVTVVVSRGDEGRYDIVNCRLLERICLGAAEVDGAPTPPLLAH
ncbi:hypothetical protein [Nocardioides rubriscoriae]|uniref:hypothetical protein n=1 Tax=Nocardioides rubriscoriae TaxID=642762 RepID=UPI0011DF455D|nr:hypothetical protein [Nocardioides rubriscoriae]